MKRREFLWASGSLAAAISLSTLPAPASPTNEIAMAGRPDGSKVWFNPYGLLIRPGQTVRWTNRDPGNAHTATSYHPDLFDRPRRIPEGASAFDSEYLLPDESFEVMLHVPGVYDFYCIPHEMSGMVGRIIVAEPGQTDFADYATGDLPAAALVALPSITDVLTKSPLRHQGD